MAHIVFIISIPLPALGCPFTMALIFNVHKTAGNFIFFQRVNICIVTVGKKLKIKNIKLKHNFSLSNKNSEGICIF